MEKTLELQFLTGEGKSSSLSIPTPASGLTQEVVQGAMETIVNGQLFEVNGIKRYNSVKGARYVTREVEQIFEVESN